jgi:hypothetical protein
MEKIIRLLAICFLSQIYLSQPLWFRKQFKIPCISPFFADFHAPDWAVWGLSGWIVLALVALIIRPQFNWLFYPILIALGLLFLFDGLFLQIWIWFYFQLFLVFLPQKTTINEAKNQQAIQWIIAAMYVWSGFFKLGPYFVEDSFPWFLEPIPVLRDWGKIEVLGYFAAFFEMSLGIGLILPKTRTIFKSLAVFFHVFIILVLSPLGHNWNTLVIPWNVAMIGLIFMCFEANSPPFTNFGSFSGLNLSQKLRLRNLVSFVNVAIILAWLGSFLSLFSMFPADFSWRMYSGTHSELTFYFQEKSIIKQLQIPEDKVFGSTSLKITIEDWMNTQTGVLPPDSEAYFQHLGRYLCQFVNDKCSSGILILNTNMLDKSKETIRELPCKICN